MKNLHLLTPSKIQGFTIKASEVKNTENKFRMTD